MGTNDNERRAARLMRKKGLYARLRRQFIPATNSNHGLPVCENILNREFQAGRGENGLKVCGVGHHVSADTGRLGVSDGGT
jgi:transposase InsO family protein